MIQAGHRGVGLWRDASRTPGRERERQRDRRRRAYTIAEVLVGIVVLGILTVSLFGAFSSGLAVAQLTRENLRATQILTQKQEALRLLTWSQGANPALATTEFTDWYDPAGTSNDSSGACYHGFVSVSNAPAALPADYAGNVRMVTVTLYWTNTIHGSSNVLVRSRQAQTLVARYGAQNYNSP